VARLDVSVLKQVIGKIVARWDRNVARSCAEGEK